MLNRIKKKTRDWKEASIENKIVNYEKTKNSEKLVSLFLKLRGKKNSFINFDLLGKIIIVLGNIKDEKTVDFLTGLLDSPWNRFAADSLGSIGNSESVNALIHSIYKHAQTGKLYEAYEAKALGIIGNEKAISPLIFVARTNKLSTARKKAIYALSNFKKDEVYEFLIELDLNEKDSSTRETIKNIRNSCFNSIDSLKILDIVKEFLKNSQSKSNNRNALFWLEKLGAPAANIMVQYYLNDKDENTWDIVLNTLKKIKISEYQDQLFYSLNSSEPRERIRALYLLGTNYRNNIFSNDIISDVFVKSLQDEYTEVRKTAISFLAEEGESSVVALSSSIFDEDPNNRKLIASALGSSKNMIAVNALIKSLKSERDSNVKITVVEALESIDSEQVIEPLIRTLKFDNDPKVRRAVAKTLGNLESREAINALTNALDDTEQQVIRSATSALTSIKDEKAFQASIKGFKKLDNPDPDILNVLFKISKKRYISELFGLLRKSYFKDTELKTILNTAMPKADLSCCEHILYLMERPYVRNHLSSKYLSYLFGDYEKIVKDIFNYVRIEHEYDSDGHTFYNFTYLLDKCNDALSNLCKIKTNISNNLLHLVSNWKDAIVEEDYILGEYRHRRLSFETQRRKAQTELIMRNKPPYDPAVYLNESEWKIQ
jgi:HEAT repeat protein